MKNKSMSRIKFVPLLIRESDHLKLNNLKNTGRNDYINDKNISQRDYKKCKTMFENNKIFNIASLKHDFKITYLQNSQETPIQK